MSSGVVVDDDDDDDEEVGAGAVKVEMVMVVVVVVVVDDGGAGSANISPEDGGGGIPKRSTSGLGADDEGGRGGSVKRSVEDDKPLRIPISEGKVDEGGGAEEVDVEAGGGGVTRGREKGSPFFFEMERKLGMPGMLSIGPRANEASVAEDSPDIAGLIAGLFVVVVRSVDSLVLASLVTWAA